MEDEDLILEGVKNSLEAGASVIDIYIDGDEFSIIDDGKLEYIPDFKEGSSSKGEKRGRGLYLLARACNGRCSIDRKDGRTLLKGRFERALEADKVIPFCFNLTSSAVYHSMRGDVELYRLDSKDLDAMGINPENAIGIARIKRIIREKEQRSL